MCLLVSPADVMERNQFKDPPTGCGICRRSNGVAALNPTFGWPIMVKQCVNSSCREEFKLLNGGDLYALERRIRQHRVLLALSRVRPRVRVVSRPDGHRFGARRECHPSRATAASRRQSAAHLPHDEAAARHDALRRTSIHLCVDRRAVFRGIPHARRPGELNCARGAVLPEIGLPAAETNEGRQYGRPVSFRSEDAKQWREQRSGCLWPASRMPPT